MIKDVEAGTRPLALGTSSESQLERRHRRPTPSRFYQAYRRKTYVGDNPAVLADRPLQQGAIGREPPGARGRSRVFRFPAGEHAWKAAAADAKTVCRGAPRPACLCSTPRAMSIPGGVQSTNRNMGRQRDDAYDIKAELAPQPGELVILQGARASASSARR